eukprot:3507648-Rhodomonas_salina.1
MLDLVEECENGTLLPVPKIEGGPHAPTVTTLPGGRQNSAPELVAGPQNTLNLKEAVSQLAGRTGEPFNHARVFLAGDGRAGKTALCNSIMGRPYTETHSTCGVDQHFLQVITTRGQDGACAGRERALVEGPGSDLLTTSSAVMDVDSEILRKDLVALSWLGLCKCRHNGT